MLDDSFDGLQFISITDLQPGKWSQLLRQADAGEVETLKQSLADRGVLHPLIITESGLIVDGHLRYRIAGEIGLKKLPCRKVFFDSEKQIEEMVLTLQLGRRNLAPSERDELIGRLYQLRKQQHGGDRRSDQWAKVAPGSTGNTAEVLATEHGVSSRTVKNAAGRVTFTDRYPQFRADPTGDVLDLKKYLPKLQRRERENLLNRASIKELNAKEVLQAAKLVAECGEDAVDAIEAVSDGTAAMLLKPVNENTSEISKTRNMAISVKEETKLKQLLDGLQDILNRGKQLGFDMEESPWAEMRSLIQKFAKELRNDVNLIVESKEEGHERCD